jgi:Uma2 family endonuclease
MPAVVEFAPQIELPPHKLWTREECETLERQEMLERESYELVDGELLIKRPKNHKHSLAVLLLVTWLREQLGALHVVQETSIDLRAEDNPRNAPEPDIVVVDRPFGQLAPRPKPSNVMLAVEVSESSLNFDLGPKARLYARAGIPEYWVLDLNGDRLIVHRDPAGDAYGSVAAYAREESVTPLSTPGQSLQVEAILQ